MGNDKLKVDDKDLFNFHISPVIYLILDVTCQIIKKQLQKSQLTMSHLNLREKVSVVHLRLQIVRKKNVEESEYILSV